MITAIIFFLYLCGIIGTPILMVYLNKKYLNSMDLGEVKTEMTMEGGKKSYDREKFSSAILMCSVFWPIGLLLIGYNVLVYWHTH